VKFKTLLKINFSKTTVVLILSDHGEDVMNQNVWHAADIEVPLFCLFTRVWVRIHRDQIYRVSSCFYSKPLFESRKMPQFKRRFLPFTVSPIYCDIDEVLKCGTGEGMRRSAGPIM